MNGMKKMKWLSLAAAAALVLALLTGCGGGDDAKDPKSYHFTGETLVQQTGAPDSYRMGELDLKEDGTAEFRFSTRDADSAEATLMNTWNQGTWIKNEDGTISISMEVLPEGGGKSQTDTGGHVVETQISLEEGELTAEPNNDGKLTVEISLKVDLITFSIQQYTAIELVAD